MITPLGGTLDLRVRISAKDREKLGQRLVDEIGRYEQSVAERHDLLRVWRNDYEMTVWDGPTPWPGASTIRAPFVCMVCDQHATRLNSQIVQTSPPFSAVAKRQEAVEMAQAAEDAMESVMDEAGWKQIARLAHKELVVAGEVLVRVTHERKVVRAPRPVVEMDQQRLVSGILAGEDPAEALTEAANASPGGIEFEDQVIYDGVALHLVRAEEMLLLPHNAKRSDDCWGIGERIRIRGWDLLEGVEQKKYDRKVVRLMMGAPSDPMPESDVEEALDASEVDVAAGNAFEDEDAAYREYECAELCWFGDLNRDGHPEWYVVTVHLATGLVPRVQYMPYGHAQAYYAHLCFDSTAGQLHGRSLAQLLQTTQDGGTACVNNFNDLVTLMVASAGNFFYDETSGLKPNSWVFTPGKPQQVTDVEGIKPMTFVQGFPAAIQACLQALGVYRDWTELLGASSNPVLGKPTAGDKTLGEIQIVVGQAMQVFEERAAQVAMGWKKVWDLARWTVADFNQGGEVAYRKSARPNVEFGSIPADALRADIDFIPAGLNEWAEPSTRVTRDQFVNNLLMRHPLGASNPLVQLQLIRQTLRDIRYPNADSLMQLLEQAALMQAQMQAAMAMGGMADASTGGGGMPMEGGAPPPGAPALPAGEGPMPPA